MICLLRCFHLGAACGEILGRAHTAALNASLCITLKLVPSCPMSLSLRSGSSTHLTAILYLRSLHWRCRGLIVYHLRLTSRPESQAVARLSTFRALCKAVATWKWRLTRTESVFGSPLTVSELSRHQRALGSSAGQVPCSTEAAWPVPYTCLKAKPCLEYASRPHLLPHEASQEETLRLVIDPKACLAGQQAPSVSRGNRRPTLYTSITCPLRATLVNQCST